MDWARVRPPPLSAVHERWVNQLKPELQIPFRPQDRVRTPIVVNNCVFRVDTQCNLPMLRVLSAIFNCRRRRVKFPQMRIAFGESNTSVVATIMIYTTGVFVSCGTRSQMAALAALQLFRLDLLQCGIDIGLGKCVPVNVVVNASMPWPVDIVRAYQSKQLPDANLTEGDFPGIVFRVRAVEVLAFTNGKCVFTGAPNTIEMEFVRIDAEKLLTPFSLPNENPPPSNRAANGSKRGGARSSKPPDQRNTRKPPRPALKRTITTATDDATPEEEKKPPKQSAARTRKPKRETRIKASDAGETRGASRTKSVAFQMTSALVLYPNQNLRAQVATAPPTPAPALATSVSGT